MIEISAQAAIVNQALKRLPMQKGQRDALVAAHGTLQKLDNLRSKLLSPTHGSREFDDSVADDLIDLLGLEPKPVVKTYGAGKHAQVPQS